MDYGSLISPAIYQIFSDGGDDGAGFEDFGWERTAMAGSGAGSGIGLFDLADKRLAWIDQRQQLLAQNLANADTPGWQPKDLAPFAATLAKTTPAALALTNPLHLAGPQGSALAPNAKARPEERAPDGNAVAIDGELTKVAQTNDTHALVINLYQTYLGMFRTALDR